jgi:hypothetical protein
VVLFISCKENTEKNIVNNVTTKQTDYVLNKNLLLNNYSDYKGFIPEDGFVPNEKIAFQIAESVLIQIYGKETIENEKPFSINLENDIWIVEGSLEEGFVGGVAYIEINKNTGQILKVIHTK